jgi:hypothetical protein
MASIQSKPEIIPALRLQTSARRRGFPPSPPIIRLLFVLGFFTFNGAMLLVYLIMAIVTPEQ